MHEVASSNNISGFGYNEKNKLLFWSDVDDKKIYKKLLYKDDASIIASAGDKSKNWEPHNIAVDDKNNKLYVIDKSENKIDLINLRDNSKESGVIKNLQNPTDIAIDSEENYLFIADGSQVFFIQLIILIVNNLIFYINLIGLSYSLVLTVLRLLYYTEKKIPLPQPEFLCPVTRFSRPEFFFSVTN